MVSSAGLIINIIRKGNTGLAEWMLSLDGVRIKILNIPCGI